jgi:hypothetical protein
LLSGFTSNDIERWGEHALIQVNSVRLADVFREKNEIPRTEPGAGVREMGRWLTPAESLKMTGVGNSDITSAGFRAAGGWKFTV